MIVGYGRMGREVEQILLSRKHSIAGRIDPFADGAERELTPALLKAADAVIEFSLPEGVVENCRLYAESGVPAVIGTTGWQDSREDVKKMIEKKNGTVMWGNNFSIGAHMFFYLSERAADLLNRIPGYDIWMHETHHNQKKDSPSGTALTAAERILSTYNKKTEIMPEKLDRQIKDHELHVSSSRGGFINGTHSVFLDSAADTIEITHRVRNRGGLAHGSVMAAEWVAEKKGFFQVEDFINEIMAGDRT